MRTVTLIGSSRFDPEYRVCEAILSGLGIVALTHGFHVDQPNEVDLVQYGQDLSKRRPAYDLVMLDKIQQSDAVLVIDASEADDQVVASKGYVGEETAREILWAAINDIPTAFLSDLMSGVKNAGPGRLRVATTDFVDALIDGEVLSIHVEPALDILAHVTGRERVIEAEEDTKHDVMQAALTAISDASIDVMDAADTPTIASQTLDFLNLEPMDKARVIDLLRLVDPASSAEREAVD